MAGSPLEADGCPLSKGHESYLSSYESVWPVNRPESLGVNMILYGIQVSLGGFFFFFF